MLEFVIIAAPLLSVASVTLVFLGFTKLGKTKVFCFALGEVAFLTAIAYAFQTALGVSVFAPFSLVTWFLVGFFSFAHGIWLATE